MICLINKSRFILFFIVMFTVSAAIWPQTAETEPFSFVGITISELIERFGPPKSVYAARGDEVWQDDVVFVYDAGDFYIFGSRVWQVGIKSAFGIKTGDVKAVALLVLGDEARDEGDYILYSLHGFGWPLMLRASFNDGKISAIFVFRPDY